MRRLMLTLQYIGTNYHGWQVQPNAVTVQQCVQDAIERVTGVRSPLTGCSRTDAGVHAEMFCCVTETEATIPCDKLVAALNAWLPLDMAVTDCREVTADFHPRYDARGKQYQYRIWNRPARNPFLEGRALHVKRPLDVAKMQRAAKDFLGKHDFSAFCAVGSEVEDRVRTVTQSTVTAENGMVTFTVAADGFLYNMVRIMVGTLLDIESGKLAEGCIPSLLSAGDREAAGHTAPACGLYLTQVYYDG
ncbi:MAG: tRNA pseudouridine(38-40) synthase TruA [Ruminococcaceae bacterium]|nr:tRNA pseudouridine(38-40) synthase TruA [Oscillospiraceae bacterium]